MAVNEIYPAVSKTDGTKQSVNKKRKIKRKRLVSLILVIAAVIVAAGVCISVIVNSYKVTLNKYFDSIEDINGRKFSTIIHQYRKASMVEYYNCSEDELIDEHEDVLQEKRSDLGCGEDVKIKYEILNEKKVVKEDVEEIEEDLNKNLGYIGAESVKITAVVELTLRVTVEGEDDYKEISDVKAKLIRENGKWKIYDCDI